MTKGEPQVKANDKKEEKAAEPQILRSRSRITETKEETKGDGPLTTNERSSDDT